MDGRTDGRMVGRTDEGTDGQSGDYMLSLWGALKISVKVCNLKRRQISNLNIAEGHNSNIEYKWLWLLFSVHHQIMHNMCIMFHLLIVLLWSTFVSSFVKIY